MKLSVIVPVYNEEGYIVSCLDSIVNSLSEFDGEYELLIADGMSTDSTRTVLCDYSKKYPFVRVMDNPDRLQVYALNLMIKSALGEYIVRCDAHSIYPVGYFSNLVSVLEANPDIGNVGLPSIGRPSKIGGIPEGISLALSHPAGVGVSHRTMSNITQLVDVDTLLFGAWRRSIFDEVGLFDVQFVRGQDYEHNIRLKEAGYRVCLVPGESFYYITRPTYKKLYRMIFQYASCKPQIIKKYSLLPNFRSLVPALFHSFLFLLLLISPALFSIVFSLYILMVSYFAIRLDSVGMVKLAFFFAVLVQHLAHSLGTIFGFYQYFLKGRSGIGWSGTR